MSLGNTTYFTKSSTQFYTRVYNVTYAKVNFSQFQQLGLIFHSNLMTLECRHFRILDASEPDALRIINDFEFL